MFRRESTLGNIGVGKITLLHKKGSKSDLKNYRTIAVGCTLWKVYLKVLERRLREMTEMYGIMCELQNGFRAGRRCQDNLLVLDHVIATAKANKKVKLNAGFLDITKAYDRVRREIL